MPIAEKQQYSKMELLTKTQQITQYTQIPKQADQQQNPHGPSSPKGKASTTRMVNGHEVSLSFIRFITIQKSYSLALAIQLFLSVLYYQLSYSGSQMNNLLLCLVNLSALPAILLAIFSHCSYNDLKASQMKDLEILSIQQLIIRIVLILIQPYRQLHGIKINNFDLKNLNDVQFQLNYVLVLAGLGKIGLLIGCVFNLVKFKNPRASRVCKIYGCANSNLYTIKCFFKQKPITLVSFTFFVSFLVFSFAFRVGERNNSGNAQGFQYFSNAIWMVVVTVSSVGFGDFFPQTLIGRIVGFICTFCGVMTVSIMVVVVINTFQLDQNQNKSLRILKRLEQKKQIKKITGNYLRLSLWRIWSNYKKRKENAYAKLEEQSRQQKILRKILKQKIRLSKFTDAGPSDFGLEMGRQFENIQYNVQNLMQNSDKIINYLSTQYFINIEEIRQDTKNITGFNYG